VTDSRGALVLWLRLGRGSSAPDDEADVREASELSIFRSLAPWMLESSTCYFVSAALQSGQIIHFRLEIKVCMGDFTKMKRCLSFSYLINAENDHLIPAKVIPFYDNLRLLNFV
jgi:hypothetical protein